MSTQQLIIIGASTIAAGIAAYYVYRFIAASNERANIVDPQWLPFEETLSPFEFNDEDAEECREEALELQAQYQELWTARYADALRVQKTVK